ncbi:MAG: hypothetical protein LBP59_03980 [Planctomycetaceae bacterium]|jgi:uncharacterized protein (DUF433 family)|nr:hypothetical protein [Planctomycetaceae bacterium]
MWKDSDVKKILTRLKKRESVESVAKAFNVNKGSIYTLIHSRGYDLYSLKHQLPTPDEKTQKYEMRQNEKLMKRKLRLQKLQEKKERNLAIRQKEKAERIARLVRLADMWRQGLTCREIGVLEGGLTRSRISQLLENYNKEFPKTPVLQEKRRSAKSLLRKTNMLARGKVIFEYRQKGKKYVDIAKTLGISSPLVKSSLAYYCAQNKLAAPNIKSDKISNKPAGKEVKAIITAYKNGVNLKELAGKYNLSIKEITAICGKQNKAARRKN